LTDDEIRSQFLRFFEGKGHRVIPSSSLIPQGDPTLLLTTAGMVQCKPFFLGLAKPPHPRLASCQKCFRTTDIESVGDSTHLTFFEMLGNFSVGDYFKPEAIAYAWEFVTLTLGIQKEKLWITVYRDDDEAVALWVNLGVPIGRIVRLGDKENFWGPAGDSGPCGPCTEIHYDFGVNEKCDNPDCNPSCSCGRFCEIWNLVFMQYSQDKAGVRTLLAKPNIDTGMGLERITAIMQGKNTVYDTTVFQSLIGCVSLLASKEYGKDSDADYAMRVVAEHGRAVAFLIADGVIPSNDGRGYVLRRLLRRGVLFGRRLGLETPFLLKIAMATIEQKGETYPELVERRKVICDTVKKEEERFAETLNTGLELLSVIMKQDDTLKNRRIDGPTAFKLYDTFGFPVEITREIASTHGLAVDMEGFQQEMDKQRDKARSVHKFGNKESLDFSENFGETVFTGYNNLSLSTEIRAIVCEKESLKSVSAEQKAGIILAESPFYAEMGGQVGDTGIIKALGGVFCVTDTIRINAATILHCGHVLSGSFTVGDGVSAEVDSVRRMDISRNHTATHLLHAALRKVLRDDVRQGGSLVEPTRLRFDFSCATALTTADIGKVRQMVNDSILRNEEVGMSIMSYLDAIKTGAVALFGEKYGDEVRVVSVGNPSFCQELCGGTHVSATGEIGFFEVLSESSIGSGMRRIEAVTGRHAAALASKSIASLHALSKLCDTNPEGLLEKVQLLIDSRNQEMKKGEVLAREIALRDARGLLSSVREINGTKVLAVRVKPTKPETLREIADALGGELKSAIMVLGTDYESKPYFVVTVSADLVALGYHAGNIIRYTAAVTGGSGGGKPNIAQGGGKELSKLDEAIVAAQHYIKEAK